jgi:hypothetical protein
MDKPSKSTLNPDEAKKFEKKIVLVIVHEHEHEKRVQENI